MSGDDPFLLIFGGRTTVFPSWEKLVAWLCSITRGRRPLEVNFARRSWIGPEKGDPSIVYCATLPASTSDLRRYLEIDVYPALTDFPSFDTFSSHHLDNNREIPSG